MDIRHHTPYRSKRQQRDVVRENLDQASTGLYKFINIIFKVHAVLYPLKTSYIIVILFLYCMYLFWTVKDFQFHAHKIYYLFFRANDTVPFGQKIQSPRANDANRANALGANAHSPFI